MSGKMRKERIWNGKIRRELGVELEQMEDKIREDGLVIDMIPEYAFVRKSKSSLIQITVAKGKRMTKENLVETI